MRYIKLFEQEEWWLKAKDHGEKIIPVNINGLCLVKTGQKDYYIAEEIINDHIHLYKNYFDGCDYTIGNSGWSLAEKEDYTKKDSIIHMHDKKDWKIYTYENLPQEIKDQLR